jgi:phosphohistidine phosphatase
MMLYVIRHAWAGQFGDPRWPDDWHRPLTDEGRKRFRRMVVELAARGLAPRQIATSPLVRCRQTAEIVAEQLGGDPSVVERRELVPGSDLTGLLDWTRRKADHRDEMAWVGHAPDVGRMTAALIGDGSAWIHFAKGTVAAIRFPGHPAPGQGELRWLATAKVLGC